VAAAAGLGAQGVAGSPADMFQVYDKINIAVER
jgi:hypothetical protein